MEFRDQKDELESASNWRDELSPARLPLDLDDYTLTIGEASSLMIKERCKFASNRKVQRMCRDGQIDCHKLQTTRNGQPVSEWLVNKTSLLKHINDHELKWDEGEHSESRVPSSDVSSNNNGNGHERDAGNASQTPHPSGNVNPSSGSASAPPDESGGASKDVALQENDLNKADAVAMSNYVGNANGSTRSADGRVDKGDAMATPELTGGAKPDDFGDTFSEVGERRSLASVLIENAKLTAQLEGAHDLIAEVQDDREFLREELREARAGRKDVTAIAERMLETLESIAIGGKLVPVSRMNIQPDQQRSTYGTSPTALNQPPHNADNPAEQYPQHDNAAPEYSNTEDALADTINHAPDHLAETEPQQTIEQPGQSYSAYSDYRSGPNHSVDDDHNPFKI